MTSTFAITSSSSRSCATSTGIPSSAGCVSVRKTGSGPVFATTQREPKGASRLSRSGPQRSGNERMENSVQRSEEATSELQSPCNLGCRFLPEKIENLQICLTDLEIAVAVDPHDVSICER